ncbi:hypothetical protein FKP32DRAFT_550474 [Trametes sanguinea]|nr:hypothetical protein FKP32DRAFT_550474 [Trametes sanguinea]
MIAHKRRRTTSIHDLAVEILQQIFAYACTDGGYTGYSLSLVSRYCYDVVQPLRLHNVALFSILQIESFADYVERECHSSSQYRVYHLFLSTWHDGERIAQTKASVTSQHHLNHLSPSQHPSSRRPSEWSRTRDDLDKRLSAVLPRLLRAVALDLRTLSLVHAWELRAVALPCPFPRLREFTSCGPFPRLPGSDGALSLPPPCFPAARRVHVICPTVSLVPWAHHTPALTHLRLSDVTDLASTLPYELQIALCFGAGNKRRSVVRPVFAELQQVRLQLRSPDESECSTTAANHEMFVERLRKAQVQCGAKLELVHRRRSCDGYWNERLRQDWMNGVVGESGGWMAGEQC